MVNLAHRNLDAMPNGAIAAFWSTLTRLLHERHGQDPDLEEKLRYIIDTTCKRMHSFQYRDLAQTSLGIAKTVNQVTRDNGTIDDTGEMILVKSYETCL